MSTALATDLDVSTPPPASTAVPEGAEDRGGLTVEDRVVERVAAYAVSLVPGAVAAPHRFLGVAVGDARPDGEVDVRARVDGRTAVVEAVIGVRWPTSVRSVVTQVREAVVREVAATADVQVDHVDVDVVSMTVPAAPQRRVR